jgi:photosystem II stability/assembly factor-like uncharacterized protein
MKKVLILIIGLSFTAASCNIFDLGGGGMRGVFKSEDGGQTFNPFNRLTTDDDINNTSLNVLILDPNNSSILYAGAGNGIYKSEDSAKAWKYILTGLTVADIAIDPVNSSTIYASGVAGQNGKIVKSVDGGTSWVDIYNEPSQNNTVLALAISPNNAASVLAGLNSGEIIRSMDYGKTWQTMQDLADRIIKIKFANNSAYALTSSDGLYKSADSGIKWTSVAAPLTEQLLVPESQSISSVTNFYDVAVDLKQTGVLYLGTEQGIFRTVNDGGNWSFLSLPVRNAALKTSAVAVDPTNSNNLWAAIASTIYKSVNGGLTWETKVLPTSATPDTILINPTSTNIIYLGLKSR